MARVTIRAQQTPKCMAGT